MAEHGEYVTVEVAARLTGVPARTLRRWVAAGKVPVVAGDRGSLVRLENVRAIAAMTGRPAATAGHQAATPSAAGHMTGHAAADADEVLDDDPLTVAAHVAVSPAASAQLAAIRDEWLRPLVERIEAQAQEIGRLRAEGEAAERRASEADARAAESERRRRIEAEQADQLVMLLEERVGEGPRVPSAERTRPPEAGHRPRLGHTLLHLWWQRLGVRGTISAVLSFVTTLFSFTYVGAWFATAGRFFSRENLEIASWISAVVAVPLAVLLTVWSIRAGRRGS